MMELDTDGRVFKEAAGPHLVRKRKKKSEPREVSGVALCYLLCVQG